MMQIEPTQNTLSHDAKNPAARALRTYLYSTLGTESSRRTQANALEVMARILSNGAYSADDFAWHTIDYEAATLLKAYLTQRTNYAPATINRFLSALRGITKECWRLGLMSIDTQMRISDVANVKAKGTARQKEMIDADMIASLIREANSYKHIGIGIRDRAMIAMMYQAGLRRSEIVSLRVQDVDIETGKLFIEDSKGGKSRYSFVSGNTLSHLQAWWAYRAPQSDADYVFTGFLNNGTRIDTAINAQTVYDRLLYYCNRAGIDAAPHHLRHAAITNMLTHDVDVLTVSKFVGHSSADTTRMYDRRGDEELLFASQQSDVPL